MFNLSAEILKGIAKANHQVELLFRIRSFLVMKSNVTLNGSMSLFKWKRVSMQVSDGIDSNDNALLH